MSSAVCVACGTSETAESTSHVEAKVVMSGWMVYSAGPVYLCRVCKDEWWHEVEAYDLNLDLQRRRREQGIYARMRERELVG